MKKLIVAAVFAAGMLVTPLGGGVASAAPNQSPNSSCVPSNINVHGGAPSGAPGHFTTKSEAPFGVTDVAQHAHIQPCGG